MTSLQGIKKRLQGIRNINQMTSAMELVAATKMRRSQEAALSSRAYALTAFEILANLTESLTTAIADEALRLKVSDLPLLKERPVRRTAVVLVASDKGLAGAFNSAVFRKFEAYVAAEHLDPSELSFIAIGQKAIDYAKRRNYTVSEQYTRQGDSIHLHEVEPIAQRLAAGYEAGTWDRVLVVSTHFMSTLRQDVFVRQLLPIDFAKIRATVEEIIPQTGRFSEMRRRLVESRPARPMEYIIEPSPEVALRHLLPLLFKMQVYHLILEANASEHSARRMAMKNASDNAGELIGELTREYNRSRQAAITKEIIEITSTAAALKR
jgi:F-type H+-transporting ATPase subunit gamma